MEFIFSKKIILIFLIFFVLALMAGVFYWYVSSRPESHQFQGQVVSFNNAELEVSGVHILDADPDKSDFKNLKTVKIKIDQNTRLVKTVLYMPTVEELAASGGQWNPAELKKEKAAGLPDDFKDRAGLGVIIKTLENSFGKDLINAAEISYSIQVYPSGLPRGPAR